MSEICRYSGKLISRCADKCGGCESNQVVVDEWIQPVRRNYMMECCDCGLVHTMDFRIRDGKIQFRARRNTGLTAIRRRLRSEPAGKETK